MGKSSSNKTNATLEEYYCLLSKVKLQRGCIGLIQDPGMRKKAFIELDSNEKKLLKMEKTLYGNFYVN